MSRARRVLFVGHIASRTGAPIMLLSLLRWMRRHSDLDFDVLLQFGGPLIDEYGKCARVFVVQHGVRWPALRDASERIRNRFRVGQFYRPGPLLSQLAARDIGVIYSNTIGNLAVLSWLSALDRPVLCHAHEVETSFRMIDDASRSAIKDSARRFIAVTPDIATSLMATGVGRERITVIPGFISVDQFASRDRSRAQAFRRRHRIPGDAILVGGCGTLDPRKGPDLFAQIARLALARSHPPPLHFLWVGGSEIDPGFQQLVKDVSYAGLGARVSVHPSIDDTAEFFHSIDIFALTSRDDPFPLVAVEAGACERPVVCFAGNARLVDADTGIAVPPFDVALFADAVCNLASNDSRRRQLGQQLCDRVRERHDVSVHAPRIVDLIRSFLG